MGESCFNAAVRYGGSLHCASGGFCYWCFFRFYTFWAVSGRLVIDVDGWAEWGDSLLRGYNVAHEGNFCGVMYYVFEASVWVFCVVDIQISIAYVKVNTCGLFQDGRFSTRWRSSSEIHGAFSV